MQLKIKGVLGLVAAAFLLALPTTLCAQTSVPFGTPGIARSKPPSTKADTVASTAKSGGAAEHARTETAPAPDHKKRPPGWDKGKKKGWGGSSMPPGLARKREGRFSASSIPQPVIARADGQPHRASAHGKDSAKKGKKQDK